MHCLLSPPFLLEPTRVDDLRRLYPDLNRIYKGHFDDARFDVVKGHEFKSLKERLIAVLHFLEKYPESVTGKRTELIHAVLSEDNPQRAQQIFPKSDKKSQSGKTPSLWSIFMGFFSRSKGTDEELLQNDGKKITSDISDSNFLLKLKDINDKELEAPIQAAVDLACSQLSSSIDTVVKKMTNKVAQMQQAKCKRSLQCEIEADERTELDGRLQDFIQAINKVSDRRRTS